MRYFFLSRRFLIPMFIVWILHIAYLEWEMWSIYGPDLSGKGFPASFIFEWFFFHAAGEMIILGFLISSLIGIVIYTHGKVKKQRFISSDFFLKWNLVVLLFFAVAAFIYSSFIAPKNKLRSLEMLAEFVYVKSYDEFKTGTFSVRGSWHKSAATMTLPELFHARDSLKAQADIKEKYDFPYLNNNQRELDRIRYEINKKVELPFTVIIFYFLGICVGASFYRIHVVIPVLISYFILFTTWFYAQRIFEGLYYRQFLGVFFAANGTTLIFALLTIAWFFVLKKYGLFKNRENELQSDRPTIFNTD